MLAQVIVNAVQIEANLCEKLNSISVLLGPIVLLQMGTSSSVQLKDCFNILLKVAIPGLASDGSTAYLERKCRFIMVLLKARASGSAFGFSAILEPMAMFASSELCCPDGIQFAWRQVCLLTIVVWTISWI